MGVYLRMRKKGFAEFNPRCIGGVPRFRIRVKSCDCPLCCSEAARLQKRRFARWRRLTEVLRQRRKWRRGTLRAPPPAPLSVDSASSISSFNPDDWDDDSASSISSFASTSSTFYVAPPTLAAPQTLAAPSAPVPGPVFLNLIVDKQTSFQTWVIDVQAR